MTDEAKLVAEQVRAADHDRYLSALYAPQGKRGALLSLYAFDAEIVGIRGRIREALPGEVRLQWWRDTIANRRAGEATGHPVADALLRTIAEYDLPERAFDNYLEARIFDLYDDPMPSRTDLEGYCGETSGALIQLAAMVLDAQAAPDFAALAGHAGCAQAITGLLRRLPVHRARGQCYVPRDILAAAGTTPEEFITTGANESAERAVLAMIALAQDHLSAFVAGATQVPQTLRPAFLPLAPVPAYLAVLVRSPRAALAQPADIPGWKRHWRLFNTASKGW
ncbi:phytoene/squalene synthase family protein [Mesorhizobium sp. ASY16-5R]|uniref:phytoene/squalene synthase family protein n=1 Tax=Mesorhizobium sp. ASY16-5R TaxID=3445772 RepID=UPI003FA028EE